jgi:hypothetical protein
MRIGLGGEQMGYMKCRVQGYPQNLSNYMWNNPTTIIFLLVLWPMIVISLPTQIYMHAIYFHKGCSCSYNIALKSDGEHGEQ